MSSFPPVQQILDTYEVQLEALERFSRARSALVSDPSSLFHGLDAWVVERRLENDRVELDHWALMMLVAAFEATVRHDMARRIERRTKDPVRKLLKQVRVEYRGRVPLPEVLEIWEDRGQVPPALALEVRRLVNHRHWLAHGRYWSNKLGVPPRPLDAHADLTSYLETLQITARDFPLA